MSNGPTTHTITISLGATGIDVTPNDLLAREGDTLEWKTSGAGIVEFAVDFCPSNKGVIKPRSPIPQISFSVPGAGQGGGVVKSNAGGAPPRRYRYAVAVWDGSKLYVIDPEIRIRP